MIGRSFSRYIETYQGEMDDPVICRFEITGKVFTEAVISRVELKSEAIVLMLSMDMKAGLSLASLDAGLEKIRLLAGYLERPVVGSFSEKGPTEHMTQLALKVFRLFSINSLHNVEAVAERSGCLNIRFREISGSKEIRELFKSCRRARDKYIPQILEALTSQNGGKKEILNRVQAAAKKGFGGSEYWLDIAINEESSIRVKDD